MSMTATFEVRNMTAPSHAERSETAAMLAEVFSGSPLFLLAFPEARARDASLQSLFTAILDDAVRFGKVETAYDQDVVIGALIWYRPGNYPMTAARIFRQMPRFLRIAARSPSGTLKLARVQSTLDRLRPNEPHCHGCLLGGRPGKRIGAFLGKRLLQEADENHRPVYLETQDRRTINLYAQLGFKILNDGVESIPGDPLTWTMWREPRAKRGKPALKQNICAKAPRLAKEVSDA